MAYEIVYTSSKAGLGPGNKGFCVVGATNGIPPATLKTLESLSGYRHMHPPAGGPHPSNPTVFSHLLLPTGESILSRKCDAGLDYSGRSNNLSHHFVVAGCEQCDAGPTRVMTSPGMMIHKWDGDSRTLAPRTVQSSSELSGVCNAWHRATGDAGWGGELANTALNSNKREAYIIFDEGTDCFLLIDEALSLLPPRDRWGVTFSTFLTSLPPNMKCQWRCVMKGSKEHQSMPPHSKTLKLDLTTPMGKAPGSAMADAARTGNRIAVTTKSVMTDSGPAKTSAIATPTRSLSSGKPTLLESQSVASSLNFELDQAFITGARGVSTLSTPPIVCPPQSNWQPSASFKKKQPSKLPIVMSAVIAGLFGMIVGGAGVFTISHFSKSPPISMAPIERQPNVNKEEVLFKHEAEIASLIKKEKELNLELIQLRDENRKLNDSAKKDEQLLNQAQEPALSKPDTLAGAPNVTEPIHDKTHNSPAASSKVEPEKPNDGLSAIVLKLLEKPSDAKFSSQGTIQLIDEKNNVTKLVFKDAEKCYAIKSSDLSPDTKLLKLNEKEGKFTFREEKDWKAPHDKKLVVLKVSDIETFYQFGRSNTIDLSIEKSRSGTLPIRFLQPTSIDIADWKQDGVLWSERPPQAPNNPDAFKQTWFVEAKGEKMAATPNSSASYSIKKAELIVEWVRKENQFTARITVNDSNKPEHEVKDLISITDLTEKIKKNPFMIEMILREVNLKWHEPNKVDLRTEIKIQFNDQMPSTSNQNAGNALSRTQSPAVGTTSQ